MSDVPALAISASNPCGDAAVSAALRWPDGRVVAAVAPAGARSDLVATIAGLCREHGVRPPDLRELRLDLGPGSYTGLRVAVTFARFLMQYGNLAVLATDSLALLATAAVGRRGGRLRPLLDARRERFHLGCLLSADGGRLRQVDEPRAVAWSEVLASLQPGDLVVTPPTVAASRGEALRARGAVVVVATGVTARDLFRPELDLRPHTAAELEPRYLMASYAE